MGIALSVLHPLWPLGMLLAFASVAVLAFRYALFWLFALPSIIFFGSLYPLSGCLVFQERDILISGLVVGQLLSRKVCYALPRSFWRIWGPCLACILFSAANAVLHLPAFAWGDQLGVYTSVGNSWMQSMALVWVALLVPPAFNTFASTPAEERQAAWMALTRGVQVSAFLVCLVTLLERGLTVGLLDFSQPLRVTGPFTSMHIGGQHIDAYWGLTIPFVFQFSSKRLWSSVCLWGLQLLCAFAIFATMSRALIAYAGLSVCLLGSLRWWVQRPKRVLGHTGGLGLVMGFSMVLVAGIALWKVGDAVRLRFATTAEAFETRWNHWSFILHKTTGDLTSTCFGHGLGSYPYVYRQWRQSSERPIGWEQTPAGPVVRLVAGEQIFLEQIVDGSRPRPWTVRVDLEHNDSPAGIAMVISHKSLLHSYDQVTTAKEDQDLQMGVLIPELPNEILEESAAGPASRRWCPTTFALHATGVAGCVALIQGVTLLDAHGAEILRNGQWKYGTQSWFFTCDEHLVWRSKNSCLHLLVETGLVGLLSFIWLYLAVFWRSIRQAWQTRSWPCWVLSFSLLGFWQMGLWGTLLDVPSLLIFLALVLAAAHGLSIDR